MSDRLVRYRKQCNCVSTASGPRVVLVEGDKSYCRPEGATVSAAPRESTVLVRYMNLACDNCNMEWAIAAEGRG